VSALTSWSSLPKSANFWFVLDNDSIGRIRCVSAVYDLSGADPVIEAFVENKDVKEKLFVELDKIRTVRLAY
jgi:3-hydroxyacyl-CoA dehydrogenase